MSEEVEQITKTPVELQAPKKEKERRKLLQVRSLQSLTRKPKKPLRGKRREVRLKMAHQSPLVGQRNLLP